jgi:hypothetical protein
MLPGTEENAPMPRSFTYIISSDFPQSAAAENMRRRIPEVRNNKMNCWILKGSEDRKVLKLATA